MFEIISRKTKTVTPEKAAEWLLLNNFMSQRNLRDVHVRRLASTIEKGNFTTGNIAFAVNPDRTRNELMNGQHQLHAVIMTGRSIVAHVEVAVCPTMKDASQYFAQFDVGATRSIGDIVKAESDSLGITWSSRISSLLVSAMGHITSDNSYRTPSKTMTKFEQAEQLRLRMAEGQFLTDIFTGESSRTMMRVPVAVAAIMTFHVDPDAALSFWEGLRLGTNFSSKDPRRPLRDFLMSTPISARGMKANGAASPREITARCIYTWNSWRRNEPRTMLPQYNPGKNMPTVI